MLRDGASPPYNPCLQLQDIGGDCREDLSPESSSAGAVLSYASAWALQGGRTDCSGIYALKSSLFITLVSHIDGGYRHTGVCLCENHPEEGRSTLNVGSSILYAGVLDRMKKSSRLRSPQLSLLDCDYTVLSHPCLLYQGLHPLRLR